MKTINFTNEPDFEVLAAAGIIMTCDDNMDYTISDEDYAKMEAEFPAAYDDSYIVNKFSVYICTPVESTLATIMPGFKEARFETLEDAREYIDRQTRGEKQLDPRDTDNGNNNHWYEVYEGEPFDEDGGAKDFVYISESYYND